MKRIPEGARRVCVVLGTLLGLAWVVWVSVVSDGFSRVHGMGWVVLVAGSVAAYFAPFLVYRVVTWVREGFSTDRQAG